LVEPVALQPEAISLRPSARGKILFLGAVVLAGGLGFLGLELYQRLDLKRGATPGPIAPAEGTAPLAGDPVPAAKVRPASSSDGPPSGNRNEDATAEPPAGASQPVPSEVRLAAAARELGSLAKSTSPRVRRLAAQALARTGDPAALELLRQLLAEEQSQLGRIQIAYALARAGDTRARDTLRGLLSAERRDVRLDAARSLIQLGDDSGRKALRAMLSVASHKTGAAGLLARLKDDEGLKILRTQLAAKDAPESVMRAAVALGRAGDASVRERLHEILADRRYNVGAADALAALGDPACVEALTQQLRLSALRVQAALWLRRLEQTVDLEPLVVALESGDDAARVSAAEALLILTGPEALAESD
jgi:HEAT repeat protein